MIGRDLVQRYIKRVTTLGKFVSVVKIAMHRAEPTLGSAGLAVDCASTTRCANLMQQMRTVGSASSHILRILFLIATIRSHVVVSYELLMLPIESQRPALPHHYQSPFNPRVVRTSISTHTGKR